ncbi:hypothetical protein B9Q03_08360 [Candidatus Marsarchaeota G2 archaeon OSP_D]|uniref:Uncharacterized protein n=3 Tax=Candidatus Marsarchaeota group 2 TaxID=2203771 RepID=A0A2R6B2C8_9ARCH|nr:MAG: hypothetical protein B9Q03_08360 [Candidatus Marsarchaeota G2 archaeon OSP_D]PSN92811.1 MAG: hypothetical protein B9Q08_00690 [Candidatus Marsarchaeota G2 archaeon ECH_B_SAG-M15]PSN94064.1 MAG: hypothetical protein B9Q09_04615 [Candidatus Marsarchaeota G2 archaeon ECH_B_SAG-C16]
MKPLLSDRDLVLDQRKLTKLRVHPQNTFTTPELTSTSLGEYLARQYERSTALLEDLGVIRSLTGTSAYSSDIMRRMAYW